MWGENYTSNETGGENGEEGGVELHGCGITFKIHVGPSSTNHCTQRTFKPS